MTYQCRKKFVKTFEIYNQFSISQQRCSFVKTWPKFQIFNLTFKSNWLQRRFSFFEIFLKIFDQSLTLQRRHSFVEFVIFNQSVTLQRYLQFRRNLIEIFGQFSTSEEERKTKCILPIYQHHNLF